MKLSTTIRLCALTLVILFFAPTSIVSCSSYGNTATVEISPCDLASGDLEMKTYDFEEGETSWDYLNNVEAQPGLYVMLILSIIILFLGSKYPIFEAILSFINAIVMYTMQSKIADYIAQQYNNMVVLEKTTYYYDYIIVSVAIVVLLIIKKFYMHGEHKDSSDTKTQGEPKDSFDTKTQEEET